MTAADTIVNTTKFSKEKEPMAVNTIRRLAPLALVLLLGPAVSQFADAQDGVQDGYYIDDGRGVRFVQDGDPHSFQAESWKIELYKVGDTPRPPTNHWGLKTAKTAQNAMDQLRRSQEFELVWNSWLGRGRVQNASGTTYYNPRGPIAVVKPLRNHVRQSLASLESVQSRMQEKMDLFTQLTAVIKEGRSSHVGSVLHEYGTQIIKAMTDLGELQADMHSGLAPDIESINRGIDSILRDLEQAEKHEPALRQASHGSSQGVISDYQEYKQSLEKLGATGPAITRMARSRLNAWKKEAHAGNVEAQVLLGRAYELGLVDGRGNQQEANRLFLSATQRGNPAGMFNLAYYHETQEDYQAAMQLYVDAYKIGFPTSANSIAGMYINGKGVPKDRQKARHWYLLAANEGCSTAMYNLGKMFRSSSRYTHKDLFIEADNLEARKWFRRGALNGHVDSMYALASIEYIYFENCQESLRWLQILIDGARAGKETYGPVEIAVNEYEIVSRECQPRLKRDCENDWGPECVELDVVVEPRRRY